MIYDIFSSTAPAMPKPAKGTECIRLLLSQVTKGIQKPMIPMSFPSFGAHISGAKFQYLNNKWQEMCGLMANLVADSGFNYLKTRHY